MNEFFSALPKPWQHATALLLVGIVAGTGSSYWRTDKFTGSEGNELNTRVDYLVKRVVALESDHKLDTAQVEWIKATIKEMRADIRAINNRLSKLPPQDLTDAVSALEAQMRAIDRQLERGKQ